MKTTVKRCYHCNDLFLSSDDELVVDTPVCQTCLDELIEDGILSVDYVTDQTDSPAGRSAS